MHKRIWRRAAVGLVSGGLLLAMGCSAGSGIVKDLIDEFLKTAKSEVTVTQAKVTEYNNKVPAELPPVVIPPQQTTPVPVPPAENPQTTPTKGHIQGTIVLSDSAAWDATKPAQIGVRITTGGNGDVYYSEDTNTDYTFRRGNIEAGTYHLRATRVGYISQEKDVVVVAQQITPVTFNLQKVPPAQVNTKGEVEILVTNANNQPVAGALCGVSDGNKGSVQAGKTDANGKALFVVECAANGTIWGGEAASLTTVPPMKSKMGAVSVNRGEKKSLTLKLTEPLS
jgi:hypothetical protein